MKPLSIVDVSSPPSSTLAIGLWISLPGSSPPRASGMSEFVVIFNLKSSFIILYTIFYANRAINPAFECQMVTIKFNYLHNLFDYM